MQPLWEINVGNVDDHGEQEVDLALNLRSDKALLQAGHAFVEHGVDIGGYGVVHANLASAFKVGAHNVNP